MNIKEYVLSVYRGEAETKVTINDREIAVKTSDLLLFGVSLLSLRNAINNVVQRGTTLLKQIVNL